MEDSLKPIGYGYLSLAGLGVLAALWLPKGWKGRLLALAVVRGGFSIPIFQALRERETTARTIAIEQDRSRLAH